MAELKPGWKRVKFGEIAECVNDRVDDPAKAGVERYVGLEHLDPESLVIRRWGTPDDVESTKLRFRPGDIIFGKRRAYQRKLAVADFEGICSAHAMVLRAKPGKIVSEFLPFFMQSDMFMERAIAISVGSLSPTINWKTLAVEEFVVPPVEEQTRFACILRSLDSTAHAIECAQQRAEQAKAAYLEDLFTDANVPCHNLAAVAELLSGGTPSRSNHLFWNGDVPWLSPKDMKSRYISDTEEHITNEAVQTGIRLAPPGSLFIVVRGMILAHTFPICRSARAFAFNQDVKAVLPRPGTHPGYLEAWFEWAAPRLIRRASITTHGTKRIETEQLMALPIPALPLEMQRVAWEPYHELQGTAQRLIVRASELAEVRRIVVRQLEPNV